VKIAVGQVSMHMHILKNCACACVGTDGHIQMLKMHVSCV